VLHEAVAEIPEHPPGCRRFLVVDGPPEGASDRFESYEAALDEHSPELLENEPLGELMLYSQGPPGGPRKLRDLCPAGRCRAAWR